ncbi:hypothetical protein [Bacillus sp. 1P06AnD]|uniref:hypothetical protein n=1 Tax=Bacillus sp. 1P06AnD TaxID=3132208 RepID=UPI0039A05009
MEDARLAFERIEEQVNDWKSKYNKDIVWFRGENGIFQKMVPSMYRNVLPEAAFKGSCKKVLNPREKIRI